MADIDVFGQLKATGETLKADLWQPVDLQTLKMIAADLVGIGAKVALTTDPECKQRYGEAAARLLDHAALLALSRLNVATHDVVSALKNFFLRLVGHWQPAVLPSLNNLIPGVSPAPPVGATTGSTPASTTS